MNDLKIKLTKKIDSSDLFMVLGTRNYVDALKGNDENIMIQIDVARAMNKPFLIVIDRNLSKENRQYLEEYFSKDNIMSKIDIDMGNKRSAIYMSKEIKRLMSELRMKENDDNISFVLPYDNDDGDT